MSDATATYHDYAGRSRSKTSLLRRIIRLVSIFRAAPRPLSMSDFSDRDLADLDLRRHHIVRVDPREMRLF